MKAKLLLCWGLCLSMGLYAQVKMPAETQFRLYKLQQLLDQQGERQFLASPQKDLFPLVKMNGQWYVSCVAQTQSNVSISQLREQGLEVNPVTDHIITLRIPLQGLDQAGQLPGIAYLEMAERIQPMLNKAVHDVGADSVHMGIGLPHPFTGKDIIIGITDWGFDYTHPMFYDTNLTQTRILAAWDQYKTSGPAPSGFTYGTEYSTVSDLLTAGSDTANIYQYAYHGSHVAGICGGSGAGTIYRGVAFDAQYLFCTFLVDAASVLDAITWMKSKADAEGKRLVINMSWGLYYMGNLDGTSLISQALNQFAQQGVVFCVSAGNNGDVNFHIRKDYQQDTLKTNIVFFPYSVSTYMYGQCITAWGTPGTPFSTSLVILNSSNQVVGQTPFYATDQVSAYVDTMLVIGSDTVFYNLSAENANPLNNRPHIQLRVMKKNTSLRAALFSTADSSIVDYWNVIELTNGVGNWGSAFSSLGLPGWQAGDANYGIGEPSCTEGVISVAAYQSKTGTSGGFIASFSSYGPTIDGRMKPDISAPGRNVISSISSYTNGSFTQTTSVTFNNRNYPFAALSGTSMSAPMVTGIVALMLEANNYLTPQTIKEIIIETAREDNNTGAIPPGGSTRWGFGKIDAYRAVLGAYYYVGIPVFPDSDLLVYPNPTADAVTFYGLPESEVFAVTLYNLQGAVVAQFSGITNGSAIQLTDLPAGMYIANVGNNQMQMICRIVRQ